MDQYLNVYRGPVEILARFSFEGFDSILGRSRYAGITEFEHCEDVHRVFVTLDGRTRATVAEFDERATVRRPDRPGAVTIVPAGVRRRVLLDDIDILILKIGVTDAFLRQCLTGGETRGPGSLFELPIVQNVRNRWLLRAGRAFKDASLAGGSTMQLQTLAFAIVRHMTRSARRVSESGGLDPHALRRVLELMQDRLSEDLALQDLADEAGLSVSAFGRAFSKSLGVPPYRYFAAARMQRATELLTRSNMPIAAIAGETGYADQAHFTAAFTRHTGVSPGKWRSESEIVPLFLPIWRKTGARLAA